MLDLRGVSIGYGGELVVHEVSLRVGSGEIVALIGANGAGKSTIAKAVSGLLPISTGTILLDGRPIEAERPRARVMAGLVHIPEGRQIFPNMSVKENLELGAYAYRSSLSGAALDACIQEVCRPFPALLTRQNTPAGFLSGGQQQMLAIARGLMSKPRLVILDEPSLGLSPALVSEIFTMIGALKTQGLSVLLSEQNARLSLEIADHAYVVEMGRVVLEGPGPELSGRPEIAERYLGVGKALGTPGEQQAQFATQLQEIFHHAPTRNVRDERHTPEPDQQSIIDHSLTGSQLPTNCTEADSHETNTGA